MGQHTAGICCCFRHDIYVFYWKGPEIRARSKFALSLAEEREDRGAPRERAEGSSYLRTMSIARSVNV